MIVLYEDELCGVKQTKWELEERVEELEKERRIGGGAGARVISPSLRRSSVKAASRRQRSDSFFVEDLERGTRETLDSIRDRALDDAGPDPALEAPPERPRPCS
jgi:hypothetical protein